MGIVLVPRTLPRLPSTTAIRSLSPVRGTTVGALDDYAAHLAGWRILRRISQICDSAVDATTHATTQVNGETWMRWTTSPLATHLWIALTYYAEDRGATSAEPVIDAVIQTPAGVGIDAGIRWRRSDGTLPLYQEGQEIGVGVLHVYTPARVRAGEGGSMTGPRPLVLPAGGSDVELALSWANARVFTITTFDVWREVVSA